MFILGIILALYGIIVFWITLTKPEKIWNMGKIQAFIKILGDFGTRLFFILFGCAALVLGIWLMIKYWPAA
ncbi:MAG: hypothetical protein K0B52_02590 [FCB group bacterium]|nr:hypothetical protein [FCB group bacterium]